MRCSVDTNVLVRATAEDDPKQSKLAQQLLSEAEVVALSTSAPSELVWALRKVYGYDRQQIASVLEKLLAAYNTVMDEPAVRSGIAFLKDGGDFADGVIAFEGEKLGGEIFVSFDKKAIALCKAQGRDAKLLS